MNDEIVQKKLGAWQGAIEEISQNFDLTLKNSVPRDGTDAAIILANALNEFLLAFGLANETLGYGSTVDDVKQHIRTSWDNFLNKSHKSMRHVGIAGDRILAVDIFCSLHWQMLVNEMQTLADTESDISVPNTRMKAAFECVGFLEFGKFGHADAIEKSINRARKNNQRQPQTKWVRLNSDSYRFELVDHPISEALDRLPNSKGRPKSAVRENCQ